MTDNKDKWEESIPYVSSLLTNESVKIQAKALWLLGEMGLVYPLTVQNTVPVIAFFCDSPVPLLRERAVHALGSIGRGDYSVIEPYWMELFRFAADEEAKVRPEFVRPYVEELRKISETDENRVVRIHCSGAIRATAAR